MEMLIFKLIKSHRAPVFDYTCCWIKVESLKALFVNKTRKASGLDKKKAFTSQSQRVATKKILTF